MNDSINKYKAGKVTYLYTNWRSDRNLRYYFYRTLRVVDGAAKVRTIVEVRGQYHQRATNPLVHIGTEPLYHLKTGDH